jgi:hypothetical protein
MGNFILGPKVEKTNRYINGIFQISTGGNTYQYQFCKDVEVSLDDSAVDRDRIDDGTPAFTRVGDILGRFRFHLKNTVDLYDTTDTPTLVQTISYWLYKIANLDFAVISFIETQYAPNSAGNKFTRLKFDGRITKVTHTRTDNVGIEDDVIEGEITAWTSADRSAS